MAARRIDLRTEPVIGSPVFDADGTPILAPERGFGWLLYYPLGEGVVEEFPIPYAAAGDASEAEDVARGHLERVGQR